MLRCVRPYTFRRAAVSRSRHSAPRGDRPHSACNGPSNAACGGGHPARIAPSRTRRDQIADLFTAQANRVTPRAFPSASRAPLPANAPFWGAHRAKHSATAAFFSTARAPSAAHQSFRANRRAQRITRHPPPSAHHPKSPARHPNNSARRASCATHHPPPTSQGATSPANRCARKSTSNRNASG